MSKDYTADVLIPGDATLQQEVDGGVLVMTWRWKRPAEGKRYVYRRYLQVGDGTSSTYTEEPE